MPPTCTCQCAELVTVVAVVGKTASSGVCICTSGGWAIRKNFWESFSVLQCSHRYLSAPISSSFVQNACRQSSSVTVRFESLGTTASGTMCVVRVLVRAVCEREGRRT